MSKIKVLENCADFALSSQPPHWVNTNSKLSIIYKKCSKMTKHMKQNFVSPKKSECLMRQRKLDSDLLIVLDKAEEVSYANDDKTIPESCESTPVSPHIQFNQRVPIAHLSGSSDPFR